MDVRPTVNLHIEHLVVDGLGPLDPDALAAAVRTELGRLLATGPMPAGSEGDHHIARIDAGPVVLTNAPGAAATGRAVARRIDREVPR